MSRVVSSFSVVVYLLATVICLLTKKTFQFFQIVVILEQSEDKYMIRYTPESDVRLPPRVFK